MQRPEIKCVVRRQRRFPVGYNVNLCNLQSVQNKAIHEDSLPRTKKSTLPKSEGAEDDEFSVKKEKFDWRAYLESLEKTHEKNPPPLLSCHPDLLRRPTIALSLPLRETEILFKNFTKRLILKPRYFPTIKDQYIFYLKNFPLILKMKQEDDFIINPRKSTPSPKPVASPELKRGIYLKCRLLDLQRKVDELENEEPDIVFETELRDTEFDPTTWEWNKFVWPFYVPKPTRESRRRRLISPEYL